MLEASGQAAPDHFKFSFQPDRSPPGFVTILPTTAYTPQLGYGYEPGSLAGSGQPVLFSVAVPEGNYDVTVTLGAPDQDSVTTIKAETRRLMLEEVKVAQGRSEMRKFTVNVRRPEFASGRVQLKEREKGYLHWDDRLTLEFNGSAPRVAALEIVPAKNPVTVYLMGDSTVTDQPAEPWNSWGQMLPRFFQPGIAVANYAESGESIKSSLGAKRFAKVYSLLKKGDYVFLQFGHNDMKDHAPDALATYKANLERFVDDVRQRGATPVLITSMERKGGVERDTLGAYPETVRVVARDKGTVLIDLHAMSRRFYKALGGNLAKAFQDGTHHNSYGSYELAKCVIEGIKANKLDLAKAITPDFNGFNPDQPDPVGSFKMPESPQRDAAKPDGN
jgi:lysophospholipase L1-like esterase